ncbi:fork head domain-containing protein L1 [Phymastichus coffea]|uniref:fork head domain-containing protein L1 n=1 Tax=Phymastichus coffea TaxID=108790 RepID=UPI00273CC079|nr:fork head domain-containing protein L1 [Phymastichus coffea]
MCSNESPPPSKESLTLNLPAVHTMTSFLPGIEQYRLQLYHYAMAERIRLAQQLQTPQQQTVAQSNATHIGISANYPTSMPFYTSGINYPRSFALSMALLHPQHQSVPEEPKPQHSYIGLIAMAILSSPEKKLVLSDIYQHILEHYPYFRRRGPGWRNSIRHNLSLNDCFVKSGRSANGKGHYWAIHPANLDDFRRGDFRRRKAQRKVRRHMGLAVEEEPDSPSPPPLSASPSTTHGLPIANQSISGIWNLHEQYNQQQHTMHQLQQNFNFQSIRHSTLQPLSRKRQFDVASLLAPDNPDAQIALRSVKTRKFSCSEDEQEQDEEEVDVDIDVDAVTEPMRHSPEPNFINGHFTWGTPGLSSASMRHFSPEHLHHHLHLKNYSVSTSTALGSNI